MVDKLLTSWICNTVMIFGLGGSKNIWLEKIGNRLKLSASLSLKKKSIYIWVEKNDFSLNVPQKSMHVSFALEIWNRC